MPKYNIKVQLSGNDGNAYAIMASIRSALKRSGVNEAEINLYTQESMSGDYDNLLRVANEWVEIQ